MGKRLRLLLPLLGRQQLIVVSLIVGLSELTLELTATRIVAPYIGLTIYAWTSVIGVILAALAIGYSVGGRLADKRHQKLDIAYLLLIAAVVIGIVTTCKDPYLLYISKAHVSVQLQALLAASALFAPPTIALGCITPYLVRLTVTSVGSSGRGASKITSAGTVGALCGTFLTGFYLFSLVGSRNLLSALGLVLIGTSLVIVPTAYNRYRWLLLVFAVGSLITPSQLDLTGVIKDQDTAYGRYEVIEEGPYRALQTTKTAWQSVIYRNGNQDAVFEYAQSFVDTAHLAGQNKRYLVIGGGAYTVPVLLARSHPQTKVDTVEIDDQLVPLAKKYFNFKPTSNMRTITEDGRQYLNNSQQRYDMVYLDAFANLTPPFQLLTRQAVDRQAMLLNNNGVVVVNMYAAPSATGTEFMSDIAATYGSVFPVVRIYRVEVGLSPNAKQSILLLAGGTTLTQRIIGLEATNKHFGQVAKRPLYYNSGRILTDDFAPVEQLLAKQN